ncbi:MAG TPA: hypothetical protein VF230_16775 [Acidimicrobiales bacterium]
MPVPFPIDPPDSLTILPWPDPIIDSLGQHPCSAYVETFWLGVLGPSTTWLLRHLVTTLEAAPEGFELALEDTSRRLGLGERGGRHSPFMRTLGRLIRFQFAQLQDATTLAVRTRVPPLTRGQVQRLPELLQVAHHNWQQEQLRTPVAEQQRQRARQLALSYLEVGLGIEETEHQLMRLDFHPAVCHDAVRWAVGRHERALAAVMTG